MIVELQAACLQLLEFQELQAGCLQLLALSAELRARRLRNTPSEFMQSPH